MSEASHQALSETIRSLYGCDSIWVAAVPVIEKSQNKTVWDGWVQVFNLIDHPFAKRCYAWSAATGGSAKPHISAVLEKVGIDSAQAAVRSVMQENRRTSAER